MNFSIQGLAEPIDKLQRNDDFAFDPIGSTIEGSACKGFRAIAGLARRIGRALLDLFAFILAAIL